MQGCVIPRKGRGCRKVPAGGGFCVSADKSDQGMDNNNDVFGFDRTAEMLFAVAFQLTDESWPAIKEQLENVIGDKIDLKKFGTPKNELALAVMAGCLNSLANVESADKAENVFQAISNIAVLNEPNKGHIKSRIQFYRARFGEDLRLIKLKSFLSPLESVSTAFLKGWFGKEADKLLVEGTNKFNPLISLVVGEVIASLISGTVSAIWITSSKQ